MERIVQPYHSRPGAPFPFGMVDEPIEPDPDNSFLAQQLTIERSRHDRNRFGRAGDRTPVQLDEYRHLVDWSANDWRSSWNINTR
jgi:hypothetical protein